MRLSEWFRWFHGAINATNLAGAVDVVVVKHADGTMHASPFYVRFGKLDVINSSGKLVYIHVNKQPVDLRMTLSEEGQAYFEDQTDVTAFSDDDEDEGDDQEEEVEPNDDESTLEKSILFNKSNEVTSNDHNLYKLDNHVNYIDKANKDKVIGEDHHHTGNEASQKRISNELGVQEKNSPNPFNDSLSGIAQNESNDNRISALDENPIMEKTSTAKKLLRRRRYVRSGSRRRQAMRNFIPSSHRSITDELLPTTTTCTSGHFHIETDKINKQQPHIDQNFINIKQEHSTFICDESTTETISADQRLSNTCPQTIPLHCFECFDKWNISECLREVIATNRNSESNNSGGGANNISSGVVDNLMVRCLSDSDLEKKTDFGGEPTYFLGRNRKAISELGLDFRENDSDDEYDYVDYGVIGSTCGTGQLPVYVLRQSHSLTPDIFHALSTTAQQTASNSFQYIDEPFVLNITTREQALCYMDYLNCELSKLFLPTTTSSRILPSSVTTDISVNNITGLSDLTDDKNPSSSLSSSSISTGLKRSPPSSVVVKAGRSISADCPPTGIYLEDVLQQGNLNQDFSSIYLNTRASTPPSKAVDYSDESGRGCSLASTSLMSEMLEIVLGEVAISDCGGLATQNITSELFEERRIVEEQFVQNPDILYSANLVVRIDNRYYNWNTAAPIILSAILFRRRLSPSIIDRLIEQYMPTSRAVVEKPHVPVAPSRGGWWIFGRGWSSQQADQDKISDPLNQNQQAATIEQSTPLVEHNTQKQGNMNNALPKTEEETIEESLNSKAPYQTQVPYGRISLTSKELESLNLEYGENEMAFCVTTALQGTSVLYANIFLYNASDRFIVSDVDGTITRSDVIGQILPLVGRDWSHDGIAEFFGAIADNGYKFLYLSSRCLGQSSITKGYLKDLKQKGFELPRGPALLSPDSLINALYREVVARKPEEFKIDCLKTILALFPEDVSPFYAGFGNRVNDQWAYTAVGIPLQRIFTINASGIVKHHTSDYSSYNTLHEIVDQLFPPVFAGKAFASLHSHQEFSSYTYWKDDIAEI